MSFWSNVKGYVKEHPIRSAILATVVVIAVAAVITGVVMSGGVAAAPLAAGMGVLIGVTPSTAGALLATVGAIALGVGGGALLADYSKSAGLTEKRELDAYRAKRNDLGIGYSTDAELKQEMRELKQQEAKKPQKQVSSPSQLADPNRSLSSAAQHPHLTFLDDANVKAKTEKEKNENREPSLLKRIFGK